MTSEKGLSARARANRLNARKSTGPRTAAGKARVARNAMIHGFAASVFASGDSDHDWIAARIAGEAPCPIRLALAREIALADDAVRRVRRARYLFATLQAEPPMTVEDLVLRSRELVRTLKLVALTVEYEKMSEKVYKGRPLNIDNYPRFRNLFQKLAKVPGRLGALHQAAAGEGGQLWTLLNRYERDALRRRTRAVAAFDLFVRTSSKAAES